MDGKEYQDLALLTESNDWNKIRDRLNYPATIRLLHSCMGLTTELGELTDVLKKHIFYGKEVDIVNLKEEGGDLLWYLAILFNTLSTTFPEEMERNINKLEARYGDKFNELEAINRNLDRERKILEGK